MLQIGVLNGQGPSVERMHWDWSEPLTVEACLKRMAYLLNAGSWREENHWPNNVKIRIYQDAM